MISSSAESEKEPKTFQLRSSDEYAEYYYAKMELALQQGAENLVKYGQKTDTCKFWLTLEPHQQQTILASLRKANVPDKEQAEADNQGLIEQTAELTLISRLCELAPRPSKKARKAKRKALGVKGSLLHKAIQGNNIMKDYLLEIQ